MRKFCQNLQNAQLCRPKTGILSASLPSAAGQNSDTFPVLHTVERGVSLQGRGNFRKSPRKRPRPLSQNLSVLTALQKGEPLAVHANFISLPRPLPLGEVDANVVSRRRGRGCFSAAPPLPQEAGAANAACHYDPTRENGIAERPQTLRYPEN